MKVYIFNHPFKENGVYKTSIKYYGKLTKRFFKDIGADYNQAIAEGTLDYLGYFILKGDYIVIKEDVELKDIISYRLGIIDPEGYFRLIQIHKRSENINNILK